MTQLLQKPISILDHAYRYILVLPVKTIPRYFNIAYTWPRLKYNIYIMYSARNPTVNDVLKKFINTVPNCGTFQKYGTTASHGNISFYSLILSGRNRNVVLLIVGSLFTTSVNSFSLSV